MSADNQKATPEGVDTPSALEEALRVSRDRPASSYNCMVCTSTFHGLDPHLIDGDTVCDQCIRTLFELSLSDGGSFPPRWGHTVLSEDDFARALSPRITHSIERRWQEHLCPATLRVYCRQQHPPGRDRECGAFVGQRTPLVPRCQQCERCGLYTCLRCLRLFPRGEMASGVLSETRIRHACDPHSEDRDQAQRDRDAAFEGLQRGQDYQDCPGCGRALQLADGCNHITCPCGAQFCYICGRRAWDGGGHWNRAGGGCPRYGFPRERNAIFTEDLELVDQEEEDDDDEGEIEHEDNQRRETLEWVYEHHQMLERAQTERVHVGRQQTGDSEQRLQNFPPAGFPERVPHHRRSGLPSGPMVFELPSAGPSNDIREEPYHSPEHDRMAVDQGRSDEQAAEPRAGPRFVRRARIVAPGGNGQRYRAHRRNALSNPSTHQGADPEMVAARALHPRMRIGSLPPEQQFPRPSSPQQSPAPNIFEATLARYESEIELLRINERRNRNRHQRRQRHRNAYLRDAVDVRNRRIWRVRDDTVCRQLHADNGTSTRDGREILAGGREPQATSRRAGLLSSRTRSRESTDPPLLERTAESGQATASDNCDSGSGDTGVSRAGNQDERRGPLLLDRVRLLWNPFSLLWNFCTAVGGMIYHLVK